jgi:hypothetical protein
MFFGQINTFPQRIAIAISNSKDHCKKVIRLKNNECLEIV